MVKNYKILKVKDHTDSTINKLNRRLAQHKYDFKNGKTLTCGSILEHSDCKIILLEEIEIESREDLFKLERQYIENNTCINYQTPAISRKESQLKYRNKHKDEQKNTI